jgi:hypothetical protein
VGGAVRSDSSTSGIKKKGSVRKKRLGPVNCIAIIRSHIPFVDQRLASSP